jgi:hypothetical protein
MGQRMAVATDRKAFEIDAYCPNCHYIESLCFCGCRLVKTQKFYQKVTVAGWPVFHACTLGTHPVKLLGHPLTACRK